MGGRSGKGMPRTEAAQKMKELRKAAKEADKEAVAMRKECDREISDMYSEYAKIKRQMYNMLDD